VRGPKWILLESWGQAPLPPPRFRRHCLDVKAKILGLDLKAQVLGLAVHGLGLALCGLVIITGCNRLNPNYKGVFAYLLCRFS